MSGEQTVLEAVRSALHSEPRVHPTGEPIRLAFANGDLIMEAEVDRVAGKKLALEAAARIPGVDTITDRLRVKPATPMGDGDIRNKVRDALLEEITLASCTIRVLDKGQLETEREVADADGTIDVRVEDGVVTLDGDVTGPGQKRMAGVLAWWVPGSRDVINGIGVMPRYAARAGQRGRDYRCRASSAGKGSVYQFRKHPRAHASGRRHA